MRVILKGKRFTKQKVWCPICSSILKVDARDVIGTTRFAGETSFLFKCKHCKREIPVPSSTVRRVLGEYMDLNERERD